MQRESTEEEPAGQGGARMTWVLAREGRQHCHCEPLCSVLLKIHETGMMFCF